jgi:1-aminocyclopropane-1-carboxylate deaminase/D-cysteine desulfhydrase-like pyridoxal-dependent ACC family enzyme
VGISNGPPPARLSRTITGLLEAIGRDYGLPGTAGSPDVRGEYVGDGYGVPTPEGDRAIVLAARTEGIVLDPIYTGKALAGLVGRHEVPVFLHTGGSPIVFAYHEEITGAIRRSS